MPAASLLRITVETTDSYQRPLVIDLTHVGNR